MTQPSHRASAIFREAVAMLLTSAGVEVSPRLTRRRLAGTFSEPPVPSTDLLGVQGVSFLVRSQRVTELSRSLDMAQSIADADGAEVAVAILRRSGRPMGEQYALLTLTGLAHLLRGRSSDDGD